MKGAPRFFFSGVGAILIIALSIPPAWAQSVPALPVEGSFGLRLTTSPLPINLITEPGHIVSTEVRIQNNGPQTEQLKINLAKFEAFGQTGQPRLLDPTPQDTFLNWVSFSENEFSAAPGQWKSITATFNVPPEAAFGYYYAIVFSRAAEIKVPQAATAVVGGTAVLVLLEARVPQARRTIEIEEFALDKRWYEFLPVNFNVLLRNTGNVHVAPRGNIFISKGDNTDIGILEVNLQKGSVLPNSHRLFSAAWADGFPVYVTQVENNKVVLDKHNQPVTKLTWDFTQAHKLRWGKYTATMLLIYDDGHRDVPIEGTTTFWVFPWRIILSLLVIGLFVLLGILGLFKGIFRRLFRRDRRR